jgi:hypothetical protein
MLRRARRLLVLLAVLVVIVVAVAVVLGSRPALDHARTRIDDRWASLRAPLDTRYRALAPVADAHGAELGRDHGLPHDLSSTLARWNTLRRGDDASAQVDTANTLEGLASRATVTAQSSDRLRGDATLQRAVQAFAATALPKTDVDAYDSAVRAYQHLRTSGIRRLTASLFGYGPRRTFEAVTQSST